MSILVTAVCLASARRPPPGIAGAAAAAALISVAIASVLGLVVVKSRVAGAVCYTPAVGAAAARLPIADVATKAALATAAAFPALGLIGVFAASSARVFPAISSTALPPTSVAAGAASSAVALTVGVVAAHPALAASRWVAVLVSVSLVPGWLRLMLAPLSVSLLLAGSAGRTRALVATEAAFTGEFAHPNMIYFIKVHANMRRLAGGAALSEAGQ